MKLQRKASFLVQINLYRQLQRNLPKPKTTQAKWQRNSPSNLRVEFTFGLSGLDNVNSDVETLENMQNALENAKIVHSG